MEQGGTFEVADVTLDVLHTPGHTPGSVSLYCEDLGVVFTGDALVASGPARTRASTPTSPGSCRRSGRSCSTLPADQGAARARRGDHDRGGGEELRRVGDGGTAGFGDAGLRISADGEQPVLAGMPRRLYPCTPTRLNTWLDCPRRYRMTYLDRPAPAKGPPWAHNSFGASVHNALAGWWRLRRRGAP